MKRFFFLFILFLVACEPAEPTTMAPVPEPAQEVVVPETAQPDMMEEPEIEEPSVDVEPPAEKPDSEPSTEESVEVDDESTTEEPETTESTSEETEESEENVVFTAQTLAYYDGQEGRPAYVAVDGVVYDVTSSSRWRNGAHNGFQAGRDLTRQFNNQHGDSRLSRFPIVGTYTD
jgi:predicted heme/steroid binding protein